MSIVRAAHRVQKSRMRGRLWFVSMEQLGLLLAIVRCRISETGAERYSAACFWWTWLLCGHGIIEGMQHASLPRELRPLFFLALESMLSNVQQQTAWAAGTPGHHPCTSNMGWQSMRADQADSALPGCHRMSIELPSVNVGTMDALLRFVWSGWHAESLAHGYQEEWVIWCCMSSATAASRVRHLEVPCAMRDVHMVHMEPVSI